MVKENYSKTRCKATSGSSVNVESTAEVPAKNRVLKPITKATKTKR